MNEDIAKVHETPALRDLGKRLRIERFHSSDGLTNNDELPLHDATKLNALSIGLD